MKYEDQRTQLLALREQHKKNVSQNIENIKAQLDLKQQIGLVVGGGFVAILLIFGGVKAAIGSKKPEKVAEKKQKKTVLSSLSNKVSESVAQMLFDFGKRLLNDFFEKLNQSPAQKK
ncbi:MAG: hypothetical protein EAZ97_10435 [Bacteroidetes bacterium]|nr:MAG: hypothetical protein EAZ97_10435 [Bacteroidota bacterium]